MKILPVVPTELGRHRW